MNTYEAFALGAWAAVAALIFAMWFYGHGGDYDTPYKRGRDGWRVRR